MSTYRGTQTTKERLAETKAAVARERSIQHSAKILARESYYLEQKAYLESQIDALFKRLDDLESSHLSAAQRVEESKAREVKHRANLITIEEEQKADARERMKKNYDSPQSQRQRAAAKIEKLAEKMIALKDQISPAMREKFLEQLRGDSNA